MLRASSTIAKVPWCLKPLKLELGSRKCRGLGMTTIVRPAADRERLPRPAAMSRSANLVEKYRNEAAFWILGLLNNSGKHHLPCLAELLAGKRRQVSRKEHKLSKIVLCLIWLNSPIQSAPTSLKMVSQTCSSVCWSYAYLLWLMHAIACSLCYHDSWSK